LIFEFNEKKSKDLLIDIINMMGISGNLLSQIEQGKNIFLYLIDVEGFFESGTSSFKKFLNKEKNLISIRSIGSYAV
jgi:hypothetical protein